MKRGFYTIMSAQFFSSLADNALFVTAVELLKTDGAPEWQRAALVPMFALFYVVLAPFVGAFADSRPKGEVMLMSNTIKVVGCLMMLFGVHPLLAYAVVGLGAAAYSPAKYGILTELLPASQLVKANGWIEGLTITSIILGVLLGGQLVGPNLSSFLLSFDLPFVSTGVDTSAEAAICLLIPLYALAAWFNKRIPYTGAALIPMRLDPEKSMTRNLLALVPDFWHCNQRLWQDKLGQISLATTTLFWGVSGNLRYIVLAWSAAALGYTTTQASSLVGVVAIGTAVGAVVASLKMKLDHATRLMPLGIAMGCFVVAMNFIDNLMGAGRSIAVQNLNEQLCILGLGFLYTFSTGMGMSAFGAITAFGALVGYVMWLIKLWHEHNHLHHREELARLMHIARNDDLHG
jgi:LPLT family lysophospholipid transporter-like MFS transporter